MTAFANGTAFNEPGSRLSAMGTDTSRSRAIVDPLGHVLAFATTGGMIDIDRRELGAGTTIYRFGSARPPRDVAKGAWWIERREFEKLINFADSNGISIGMAMRLLCLVPIEWSDASVLIRGRVSQGLLAWRGLANSVVAVMTNERGTVHMPHSNEIAARRLHQLFIPGLRELDAPLPVISIEAVFHLSAKAGAQGFIYL